ncbi:MAG TPA: hypothetical protein VHR45_13755 [Thermoanaerobaculia bacterium]|nr:hypothetical protein [Thermoanaerobaculia bacterium]
MPATARQIERDLAELPFRPGDCALGARLAARGLSLLPALEPYLASDLPIAALESYEAVWKAVLRRALARDLSGATARELAGFQMRVGLLLKYKSYAIKASSPLGYSIFLQNPAEGFSFQRHVTHKTEVFHILDVHPGGFVFLCTYEQWIREYERDRFAAWLAGERPDPAYDRFRFAAQPGDVFILDRLGIVHTVVGCTLEEFATVSTDMVDRLHDQNQGKPIPAAFNRRRARQLLAGVRTPPSSRLVEGPARRPRRRLLGPAVIAGGSKTVLADGFVVASLIEVEPRSETEPQRDERRAAALYVRAGNGRILLGTPAELARADPPSLLLGTGDLLTVPPGIAYALVNDGGPTLEVVEHRISPEVALAGCHPSREEGRHSPADSAGRSAP